MSDPKNQPKKIKAVAGGQIKWIVTIKQWIHQGFTYLDKTERFYRIIWELIPIIILSLVFIKLCNISIIYSLIIAIIITHTLNWIFNYNFWTCIDFTFPSVSNPGNKATIEYLSQMQKRMEKYDVIICSIHTVRIPESQLLRTLASKKELVYAFFKKSMA